MKASGYLHSPVALPPIHPGKQTPSTRFIGSWVGPRASLDVMEEREISCLCRKPNSGFSVVQPVAQSLYRLSYPDSYYITIVCLKTSVRIHHSRPPIFDEMSGMAVLIHIVYLKQNLVTF
jgi:hypothetical protein